MSVQNTAQPNETANELENERKNRIRQAFGSKNVTEQDDKVDKSEEKVEKSDEKLDNKENNDYIEDKDNQKSEKSDEKSQKENKSQDDEVSKYEQILNNQFDGDGKKAVKSWRESTKEYTKLRQQMKEQTQALSELDKILQKNPVLEDFIKEARQKGELSRDDLQNFLQSDRKPQGKSDTSSNESKLGIVDDESDITNIDEQTLAEEGLLDLSKKDLMSESEWDLSRRQAAIKYAESKLPDRISNEALKRFEQQIEDKKVQEEKAKQEKQNKQINSERYQQGIDRVVDEFGLDFAGNEEHRRKLDEIEKRAAYMRDNQNPNVIRPNAIYLATLELIDEGELDVKRSDVDQKANEAKQQADNDLDDRMGFNKSASSTTGEGQPKTIAEKLRQRRKEEYDKEMSWRKETDRLNKST